MARSSSGKLARSGANFYPAIYFERFARAASSFLRQVPARHLRDAERIALRRPVWSSIRLMCLPGRGGISLMNKITGIISAFLAAAGLGAVTLVATSAANASVSRPPAPTAEHSAAERTAAERTAAAVISGAWAGRYTCSQ